MTDLQAPAIDLSKLGHLHACKLVLPPFDRLTLVLAGCGGTGSWLAPSIARVSRLLTEKFHKQVAVYFVDPDQVEAKNCYRQNFCQAEIGRNKADALAFRYSAAWGIDITAVPHGVSMQPLDFGRYDDLRVIAGCVDNPDGRQSIQNIAQAKHAWWLDCGNHRSSGQVILGAGAKQPDDPFSLPGVCSWLPLPTRRHPELLEIQDPQAASGPQEDLSCADLAMQDSQSLAINQTIAAIASDYLVRLLLTRDLDKFATYIDLGSGSMRSLYIAQDKEG